MVSIMFHVDIGLGNTGYILIEYIYISHHVKQKQGEPE